MIKVLLLDVGETLVHGASVFQHVPQALEALNQFLAADGEPLAMGLVSDFEQPGSLPATAFAQFLTLLDSFGIRTFFEPVNKRVTISALAGVRKPDKKIFEAALLRLGQPMNFENCIFITEEKSHIAAVRAMGMTAFRFAPAPASGVDFSDWSEAPLLVAQALTGQPLENRQIALNLWMLVHKNIEIQELRPGGSPNQFLFGCDQWTPLNDPHLGPLQGIRVRVPGEGAIEFSNQGKVKSVQMPTISGDAQSEAATFVKSLLDNHQLNVAPGVVSPGATHIVETDNQGLKYLRRRGFSMIKGSDGKRSEAE